MDEQKQSEIAAFLALCVEVAKRPYNAKKRGAMNLLTSFASGQYGRDAHQAAIKSFGPPAATERQEIRVGKPSGEGRRRNQSPELRAPGQMTEGRRERLLKKGVLEVRSAAAKVVAEGEAVDNGFLQEETISSVQLSTGAIFDTETGQTENNLTADAAELSAPQLVEKYGRAVLYAHLIELGKDASDLDQKTDRQLANILKKSFN